MATTIKSATVTYGHMENIVTDGLILHLDAANTNSYPGSGSVWYDLSGNDHHAYGDPNGAGAGYNDAYFPTWQSNNFGRFYFDGTKGLTILTDMGTHSTITYDTWMYKIGYSESIPHLFDGRNDGGNYIVLNYSSANINAASSLKANDPETYQANSNWWDNWIHLVITSDASGSALWINNEAIIDGRLISSNSINENLGQYFRIANRYASGYRFSIYFSDIKIYDRVLTDDEIGDNYNSLKYRFGL